MGMYGNSTSDIRIMTDGKIMEQVARIFKKQNLKI
jgi:hypothetical protein